MPSKPFKTLTSILFGSIAGLLSYGGQSLGQRIAMADDITNEAPSWMGTGGRAHVGNTGGARAHRRWKQKRASGIHARKRH